MSTNAEVNNQMVPPHPAGEAPIRTEAVGLLAAGLAHDLNNILAGITTTAELVALRHRESATDSMDLAAIAELARRASALVRQILAFSRQETLVPVSFDLAVGLKRLLPSLRALAGAKVDVQLVPPERGAIVVRVDPTALERVIVNLIVNARQAFDARGGQISITLHAVEPDTLPRAGKDFMVHQSYGAIVVEDDGPGIPPEIATRIFEPFFTTSKEGQGLGLSSAFGLVKQSGGYILHERGVFGGARFSVYLPRARAERVADATPAVSIERSVLVVDDEPLLRDAMVRGLKQRGYRVAEAADAMEALQLLEKERPSLLLTDIRMPGMDGVELARRTRAHYPSLPILLVSGYADSEARASVGGMDIRFLTKPFTLKGLGETIDSMT